MKKLNVVSLIVMGLLGFAGMSTSAKANVQKLDKISMASIMGSYPFLSEPPSTPNNGGCNEETCKTQEGLRHPYSGYFAYDTAVPYGTCIFAFSWTPCNNNKTMVCALKYLYSGQTTCQSHTTADAIYSVVTDQAVTGTASSSYPIWY